MPDTWCTQHKHSARPQTGEVPVLGASQPSVNNRADQL